MRTFAPEPTRPPAILLGVSGHPRAVAAIRSLGRAGITVIGVESDDVPQRSFSRYLHARHRVNPRPDELLPYIARMGEKRRPVLMALCDDYLLLMAKHFETLSRWAVLTVPPWDVLKDVMDHATLYRIARGLGVDTPDFFKPRDERDLRTIVAGLDLTRHEYLLKTVPGTVEAEVRNGRFTKVAGRDPDAIQANCLEIFSRLGEFPMIAEVVPGEANQCIGVSLVVDAGHDPVLAYCMKRLKLYTYSRGGFVHPYELGANVWCESVRDDEALEVSTRLVKATRYSGVITFEFRRDSRDGRLLLLKADPRFIRATSLSTAVGMDIPTALYRLYTGEGVERATTYREGVAWLWPTMYLENLWENRGDRPVRRELLTLVRNLHRVKTFAQLSLSDPWPALMHVQWRGRVWLWARLRGLARRLRTAARRGPTLRVSPSATTTSS